MADLTSGFTIKEANKILAAYDKASAKAKEIPTMDIIMTPSGSILLDILADLQVVFNEAQTRIDALSLALGGDEE